MRIHARTLLVLSLACAGPVPACASGMQPAAVAELPAAARPEATRIVPASARKIDGFPGRQRSIGERRPVEFAAGHLPGAVGMRLADWRATGNPLTKPDF
jgi:hypothetical protein